MPIPTTNGYWCALAREISRVTIHSTNVFTAYFANVSCPDDRIPIQRLPTLTTAMENLHVTPEAVAAILVYLDPHKFAGPDDLHTSLLRLRSPIISTPLADFFNNSFDTGVSHNDWWKAQVTPRSKTGKTKNRQLLRFNKFSVYVV